MEPDKLVEEIYIIVHTLSTQNMGALSGDTLSRLAVKLASYKASLGEYVANAQRVEWDAKAAYDKERSEAYQKLRDEGKGSTDAEELKRGASYDAYLALNEAKYQSARLSQLSMDCHDLIQGLKSRLIHLQTEKGESDVY